MSQDNRAGTPRIYRQPSLFESEEFLDELVDSFLANLEREKIDPKEFLMRLLVKEASEKLRKLPKHLQKAAIALLVEQFLGDDNNSDLVRGEVDE